MSNLSGAIYNPAQNTKNPLHDEVGFFNKSYAALSGIFIFGDQLICDPSPGIFAVKGFGFCKPL